MNLVSGSDPTSKKETTWVKSPEQHMPITEKTHRWVIGVRPQWSSDQVRGAQSPLSTGIPLKSRPEHRPVTKTKLFKPTLYKSYCEGSFMCEPNVIIGPQKNRVPTIGAVCGKLARWRRWRWSQLSSKQKFLGFPSSPTTYSCYSGINFC